MSGWTGPYEVVECGSADGIVALKINGQTRPYRLQDVRPAQYYATVFSLWTHQCGYLFKCHGNTSINF